MVSFCFIWHCSEFFSFLSHQIKAAVSALWNTRGLNWPTTLEHQRQRTGDLDMLDWLRAIFGFQVCILRVNRMRRYVID